MHTGIELCRLGRDDWPNVRRFVLGQVSLLTDPEYFIVDDLDSSLPLILTGGGIVFAAKSHGVIIGLQGVDFDSPLPLDDAGAEGDVSMECSWSMVAPEFRRRGIARQLLRRAEAGALAATGRDRLWATVHPANHASLRLYQSVGYFPIRRIAHFGLLRELLVKPGKDALHGVIFPERNVR